jgi:tRNA (adenine37-N6)-methyltransferase
MMALQEIGRVARRGDDVYIELEEQYADGLLGLDGFSHIIVCYWLNQNDTTEGRNALQLHPRGDTANPRTGVFATHSPRRPNPLAITVCEILCIEGARITIASIDAFDGSPVVDIKCYIDWAMPRENIRLPDWV